MDKGLVQYLGVNEDEIATNYGEIVSDNLLEDEYKILNVKVFSVGLLTNETINKLNSQSVEYKKFINLKDVEFEVLKNNDELLCETDLVLLIGEYEDTKGMAMLEYIIQDARLRDIKAILLLSVNNNIDKNLLIEISTKVDVLVPIIDNEVQHYLENAFSGLAKKNFREELAQQYINIILEFVPECTSVIAPIDIIDAFTHYKGIAYVSSASAAGEGRAVKSAFLALSNKYSLKDYKDCKMILLTFSGGESLGLLEINEAAQLIADMYSDEETILFTVGLDESMGSEMRVSIIGI
ncbi:hypothetical protein [Clostridium sp.]